MARQFSFVLICAFVVAGCAAQSPVVPDASNPSLLQTNTQSEPAGPYRLFGQWTLFINADRTSVDVIPLRGARFHLNALKFLESYCADCLKITSIKNNGDSTVDLSVKIRHPFTGHPEYTGFDVKGIMMFNGSWVHDWYYEYPPPYSFPIRISWRKMGDPQVLNADGYSLRWNPLYDIGSPQPMFIYWKGKYAAGVPNATLNAYLNYYTIENRHIFETTKDKDVTRTYHIWLPPGQPVTAGYAIEACWEPPTKTPVTNPETDFPFSANQPEAYQFYFNLNNGQPITDPYCCGNNSDPSTASYLTQRWSGPTPEESFYWLDTYSGFSPNQISACGDKWPNEYCGPLFSPDGFPDGDYLAFAVNISHSYYYPELSAYTVFEFSIHLQ